MYMKYLEQFENFDHMNKYYEKKRKFFDSKKSFDDITFDDIPTIVDYIGTDGYNNEEDAIEDLEEKLTTYKNLSNPVKLYRVVGVKDESEIDKDKLGEHFTPFLWAIDDDMMRSIGDELWDDKKPYIIEVLAPLSEIDIWQTIVQNMSFPREYEINLKNKGKGAKFIRAYSFCDEFDTHTHF